MASTARVTTLPQCDFCTEKAGYDAKTSGGPWAFMCQEHFEMHGTGFGLGTGVGQRLILEEETPA